MSLKELTKESHTAAEATPFMKAVFKKTIPTQLWKDFTYQKSFFYRMIETKARRANLLGGLEGIERADLLLDDSLNIPGDRISIRLHTDLYMQYIDSLVDPDKIMAHLYVWHMGDMFGGQMIKQIVNAPSTALDFENADDMKQVMYSKINDDMAAEANVAFEWAIKMMDAYTYELDLANAD
jgi:heme oxygenase